MRDEWLMIKGTPGKEIPKKAAEEIKKYWRRFITRKG